jgi:Tol biopolymer transport system component
LLYFGGLGEPGRHAAELAYLLDTHGTDRKQTQAHPFLSPDGTMGFFNSDESGILQAYMVRGLDRGAAIQSR